MIARLEWLLTGANATHDDHDEVVDRGLIDIVHDQDLSIAELRLGVDVGITDRFGVSASVPVRMLTTEIRYLDAAGAPVQLVTPGIHHRNETVSGFGDPMVTGSATVRAGAWRLTGRAGVTVPIGSTEDDPFALGDMGIAHQHIQLGTGTFNPVLGADVIGRWGAWGVGVFALTQQVVYESGKGFQAGDRYGGGLSVIRTFEGDHAVRAGVEVLGESAERWNGVIPTDDGNRGRFDAMVVAGYSTRLAEMQIHIGVKVPVVTHVVGGQLDIPVIIDGGWSWTFGAPKAAGGGHDHGEHDHDHGDHGDGHDDHGDGHDDHGDGHDDHGDGHDDPAGHAPPPIVPVLGKLTIVDFWATWCEPCKTLTPALEALARAHPDRVALQKIDYTNEPPGGFNLPHVKVFDDKGALIYEKSSAPGELEKMIEEVRAIVEPPATAPADPPDTTTAPPKKKPRRISVTVGAEGFSPSAITVRRNQPVVLVFERTVEKTCATEVIFTADGTRTERALPLGKRVEIPVTFETAGTIPFGCAMDMMIGGTLTVK